MGTKLLLRSRAGGSFALAASFWVHIGSAEPLPKRVAPVVEKPPMPAAPEREEHRVDFQAQRVEIAGEDAELSLAGDVVVRAERFQVTADAVTLSRSSRGVHVEGTGRLAFCRCRRPPITLGFSAADLAPPTDVLLEDATLRILGVPIFYSPYLWLRAPTRPGVLPPWFAYRGEEGVQVGSGVHVPIETQATRPGAVDLTAYGYSRGGFGLGFEASVDAGRGEFNWDYFDGSVIRTSGTLTRSERHRAVIGASWDALRGRRALNAFSSLRDAAKPMDRALVSAGRAGRGVFGIALNATSRRGRALDARPTLGPSLFLGETLTLGERVVSNWSVETASVGGDEGSVATTAQLGDIAGSVPLGPALLELLVRERALAIVDAETAATTLEGEARVRLGLPLARRFGALVHRLEPLVEAAAALRRDTARSRFVDRREGAEFDGRRVSMLGGFETAIGVARSAADLRLAAGFAGDAEDPSLVASARASADTPALRLSSEVRTAPAHDASELFANAELLPSGPVQISAFADGLVGESPDIARLFREDFVLPAGPWLSERGWSAGAALAVRIRPHVRAEVAAEYDVSAERFLGGSTALGYRHVCDCLGVSAWAGKRVGREGFDLALSVDLVP